MTQPAGHLNDPSTLKQGDRLLDRYRVERIVGRGGMGIVVAAIDEVDRGKVAIKILLPEAVSHDQNAALRFFREARAVSQIASDHVAEVYDAGTLPNGMPYIVMELLEGEDLGAAVETRGPMRLAIVVDYVMEALEAVSLAHAAGIVHRDLKPSNLFVAKTSDGREIVKVLDFGISKELQVDADSPSMGLTSTRALLGSPVYMSPEQLKSAKFVDARTDIWAFGVILYELLSARLPFDGETLGQIFVAVMESDPHPVTSVREGLPFGINAVIGRCLKRDLAERYQTAADLAVNLAPFGTARGRRALQTILRDLSGVHLPDRHGAAALVDDSVTQLRLPEETVHAEPKSPPNGPFIDSTTSAGAWAGQPPPALMESQRPPTLVVFFGASALVMTTALVVFFVFFRFTGPSKAPATGLAGPSDTASASVNSPVNPPMNSAALEMNPPTASANSVSHAVNEPAPAASAEMPRPATPPIGSAVTESSTTIMLTPPVVRDAGAGKRAPRTKKH